MAFKFMTKYVSLIFIFSFSHLDLYSQDKGYLAISIGPSFPVGDFRSIDFDNERAGFAEVGTVTDFSFAYRFGKSLGIAAMLRWQSNGLDIDPLLSEMKKLYPTAKWSATSDNWTLNGFLLGFYSSFPIEKSTTCFEVRAMLGYMSATLPDYSISGTSNGVTLISKINTQSAGTACFLLGAGFRFKIGAKASILLNMDYSSATAEFQHTSNTTNFSSSSNYDITQEMKTVNIGFGIGLRL